MCIYLDNNATTPCSPEVVDAMLPYLRGNYGNPSSTHVAGRTASRAVSEARSRLAQSVGSSPERVVFTSGATEANNIAILGVARASRVRRKIAISVVEHKSVIQPARHLAEIGYTVVWIPVSSDGIIDISSLESLVDDETLLVSVQGANNETGVIQPMAAIAAIAHKHGAIYHCDAAQLLGKHAMDLDSLGVDLASISAHKAYGPKGIGALVTSVPCRPTSLCPLLFGGQQENGLRPGTLNVPGIVGFGVAAHVAATGLPPDTCRMRQLTNMLEELLLELLPGAWINGRLAPRLPGTTSLTIPGVPADMLMANASSVCLSNGSACNAGAPTPSHVLLAMGIRPCDAESTIRISLGRYTTDMDVATAAREIADAARRLRSELGSWR